jgi:hypothetical protein
LAGPGIEYGDTNRLEVSNVAAHDCQTVNHRGRGNQGISFRARIGNMKARAPLRHGSIDCKRWRGVVNELGIEPR